MLGYASALVGALLLWLPAFRHRIDAVACPSWPAPSLGAFYGLCYLAAVALLTYGWAAAIRDARALGPVLLRAAVVHAVALVAPPFLSNDPLFYAAIGRALATGHTSLWHPALATLPPGDPLVALLPEGWRLGTSPYSAGFNELTRLVAAAGSLTAQLRVYQLLGAACVLASAALTGLTAGARAAALVAFCPLAVVDATVNPHNDAWIAVAVALYAWLTTRGRGGAALVALVGGLAVKLSALLLVGFDIGRRLLRPIAGRLTTRRLIALAAALFLVGAAALVLALERHPELHTFLVLVGSPDEVYPRVTRSVEGLPRALLAMVLHQYRAAFWLGLAWRAAAVTWLIYCAWRAAVDGRTLAWAATALFVYFLWLHGFMESWYLVPLLPLVPHAPAALQRPMRVFLVALSAYYALALPLECVLLPVVIGVKELTEAAITVLPATFTLLAQRPWAQARARGGSAPPAA